MSLVHGQISAEKADADASDEPAVPEAVRVGSYGFSAVVIPLLVGLSHIRFASRPNWFCQG